MNVMKRQRIEKLILDLPFELIDYMLEFLDLYQIGKCCILSKSWNEMIRSFMNEKKARLFGLKLDYYSKEYFPVGGKLLSWIIDNNRFHLINSIKITIHGSFKSMDNVHYQFFLTNQITKFPHLKKLSISSPSEPLYETTFISKLTKLQSLKLNLSHIPDTIHCTFPTSLKALTLSQKFISLPYCDLSNIKTLKVLTLRWKESSVFPTKNIPYQTLKKLNISCPADIYEQMIEKYTPISRIVDTKLEFKFT